MPIRGESVGAAYVEIFVDASGVPGELRREMRQAEDTMNDAGIAHRKSYQEGWEKENERHPSIDAIRKSLNRGAGKLEATGQFLAGKTMDGMRKGFVSRWGPRVGNKITDQLRESIEHGFDPGALGDLIERDMGNLVHRAVAAIKKEDDAIAEFGRSMEKSMHDAATANNREVGRMQKKMEDFERTFHKAMGEVDRDVEKTMSDIGRTMQKAGRDVETTTNLISKGFNTVARDSEKLKKAEKNTRLLILVSRMIGRVADKMNAKPRNDFLNAVIGLGRAGVRLASVFPRILDLGVRAFSAVIGRVTDTIAAFSEARRAGSSMFQALVAAGTTATEGLGAVFATIASTGPLALGALAIAIAAVELSIGPLIATLSLLAGAVTALAASITFAIAGAIAPLVGLLAPLAIGVGTVAAAFIGMDKATKKMLKESFRPLMKEFKALGAVAREGLFYNLEQQTRGFGNVFKAMRPLVRQTGRAISDVITGWLDLMRGPGFTAFLNSMTTFVPDAIRSLGRIAGNVFSGLGGVFVALEPTVRRFLDWLERITGSFSRFAQSPEGQTKMKKFFDDAGDSASKVGTLIDRVAGLLRRLMDQGRGTGDSFIDNLSAKVQDFIDYLDAHPNAISDWFSDAQSLANKIGRIADSVLRITDALDNTATRAAASATFGLIETLARGADTALSGVSAAIGVMSRGLSRLKTAATVAAQGVLRALANVIDGYAAVIHAGSLIPGPLGAAFRAVGDKVHDAAVKVRGLASDLNKTPKKKEINVAITGGAAAAIAGIHQDLNNLPENMTIHVAIQASISAAVAAGRGHAMGGLITRPTMSWIGEDGPEAVVPLNRSLSRVDPAVRELSAIAQGKAPGLARGGVRGGRTVDASGWTIVTPGADSRAVASEVVNRLVATGY